MYIQVCVYEFLNRDGLFSTYLHIILTLAGAEWKGLMFAQSKFTILDNIKIV